MSLSELQVIEISDDERSAMVARGKRAREDDDSSSEERLYKPMLSCPYCFEKLGCASGLVICAITTCRPILHLVCEACVPKLPKVNGASVCGLCRQPAGSIVPLGSLLDERGDEKAGASLQQAVKRVRADEVRAPQPVMIAPAVVPPVEDLQECRNRYALRMMNRNLPMPEDGCVVFSTSVPQFEGNTYPRSHSGGGAPKLSWRLEVTESVLPFLRQHMSDFNLTVLESQKAHQRWAYMAIHVVPKYYAELFRARLECYRGHINQSILGRGWSSLVVSTIPICDTALFARITPKEAGEARARIWNSLRPTLTAEFRNVKFRLYHLSTFAGYIALRYAPK